MTTDNHIPLPISCTASEWQRFWKKVDKSSDSCWPWQGSANDRGYGYFYLGNSPRLAHRIVYTWLVGPIPEGAQIDHTCSNPSCVNPAHLEPVTNKENVCRSLERKHDYDPRTHFKCGHPRALENMYKKSGGVACRTCSIEKSKQWAKDNPEKVRAIRERFKKKNPDYAKKWREAHPNYARDYQRMRRGGET